MPTRTPSWPRLITTQSLEPNLVDQEVPLLADSAHLHHLADRQVSEDLQLNHQWQGVELHDSGSEIFNGKIGWTNLNLISPFKLWNSEAQILDQTDTWAFENRSDLAQKPKLWSLFGVCKFWPGAILPIRGHYSHSLRGKFVIRDFISFFIKMKMTILFDN